MLHSPSWNGVHRFSVFGISTWYTLIVSLSYTFFPLFNVDYTRSFQHTLYLQYHIIASSEMFICPCTMLSIVVGTLAHFDVGDSLWHIHQHILFGSIECSATVQLFRLRIFCRLNFIYVCSVKAIKVSKTLNLRARFTNSTWVLT